LNGYYTQLRLTKEDDEKELIYEKIKQAKAERNAKVEKELTEEYVLYLVVQELDKGTGENWYLYAPLLQSEMFKNMLDDSKEERPKITKKTDGEIDVYGLKFTKT
jgi:UTP-glucose-1-phosphate uridylyltransferase